MPTPTEIKSPETLSVCLLTDDPVDAPAYDFGFLELIADEILIGICRENTEFLGAAAQKNTWIQRFDRTPDSAAIMNELIEQASSSWILVLRSNEQFLSEDASRVAYMLKHPISPCYEFPVRWYCQAGGGGAKPTEEKFVEQGYPMFYRETRLLRLFRKDAAVYFDGSLERLNFHDTSSVRCRPFRVSVPLYCFGKTGGELPTYNAAEVLVRICEVQTLQHPDDFRTYEALGTQLLELRRPDLAIAPLEKAYSLNEGSFLILNSLGYSYMEVGRHNEALQAWQLALQLNPGLFMTHMNIGVLHMRHGKWDMAVKYIEHALRIQPDDPHSHYNLGQCYSRLNDFNRAYHHFQQAVRYDPKYVAALADLGAVLVMAGRLSEAEGWLRRALSLDPVHQNAMYNFGLLLLKKGEREQGVSLFRRWTALYPQNRPAVEKLALEFPDLARL